MKNRIWTDGEGLSWSTITDLLGEDADVGERLRDCVLDLTDHLFMALEDMRRVEEELKKAKEEIQFLKGNIGACVLFGQKRLGYDGPLRYVHDQERKVVSIEIEDGKIEVKEESLTRVAANFEY